MSSNQGGDRSTFMRPLGPRGTTLHIALRRTQPLHPPSPGDRSAERLVLRLQTPEATGAPHQQGGAGRGDRAPDIRAPAACNEGSTQRAALELGGFHRCL